MPRVFQFSQNHWLNPYVKFNTQKRTGVENKTKNVYEDFRNDKKMIDFGNYSANSKII